MRAVPYIRVSTDEQSASGLGAGAQLHACSAWAEREGLELAEPFDDLAVSGAAPLASRPALIEALAALKAGDVLVVAKRDRLGRDPFVIAVIEAAVGRKKCRVVSAAGEGTDDDDPSNVLMRRVVDAFAEYERLVIKARTRGALAVKRRAGEFLGQVPYGFRRVDDGRRSKKRGNPCGLEPDPAEAGVVDLVKRRRAEGLSFRAIVRELDKGPVRPKNGGPHWARSTVRRLAGGKADA